MRRLILVVALAGCEESGDPPAAETGAATTGDPGPWWLGAFHDAMYPVGSNATLLVVGNLEIREDGTATATDHFCDDDPDVAEYTWTMAGDSVSLEGDPLMWGGGEVGAITVTQGSGCAEIDIVVQTLGPDSVEATYALGSTCLMTTGPSCSVEVIWCATEPASCL